MQETKYKFKVKNIFQFINELVKLSNLYNWYY